MTRIKEIVAKTVAQYSAGDLEGMSNQIHANIHFEISMPQNDPRYRYRKGNSRDEFFAFLILPNEAVEEKVYEISDILVSEHRVSVVGKNMYRIKALNRVAEYDFVWVFRLENELIIEFFIYLILH